MGGGYCGCAVYAPYSAMAMRDAYFRRRTGQDAEMFTRLGLAWHGGGRLFDIICAFCVYGSVIHPTIHCGECHEVRVGK